MRIAMASGKGGAGKTTVTASLASVWDGPCLVVDADVEAPNLHLFLHPELSAPESVYLEVPVLDKKRCTNCGACREICAYKAIARLGANHDFSGHVPRLRRLFRRVRSPGAERRAA